MRAFSFIAVSVAETLADSVAVSNIERRFNRLERGDHATSSKAYNDNNSEADVLDDGGGW
jgi:hypothetical protein